MRYKAPLNNVINRELRAYQRLLQVIRESVVELLVTIDGAYPRPTPSEDALWIRIAENQIPDAWRRVSFQTAHESLADYLVELGLKLEFWKSLVASEAKQMPSYWLPAFFDPKSFLTSLMQTRSRLEEVPLKDLRNEYEILEVYQADSAPTEKHVRHLHGLYLEGADWDPGRKQVVEMASTRRFCPFPGLRVRTRRCEDRAAAATPQEQLANYNVNRSKVRKKKRPAAGGEAGAADDATGAEAVNPVHQHRCPVYKTTSRLSTGLVAADNAPVEYLKLDTLELPSKWVKRAVALVLEPPRTEGT